MRYLCLLYGDETQWPKMPRAEQDKWMGEFNAFTNSIKQSGNYEASNALQPTQTATTVRVRNGKIRDARIPYELPARNDLTERLDAVLKVIYLVFNEGYSASAGDSLTRPDLSSEAIRLGRLLVELLPEPESIGLLALMLLHDARRAARTSPDGEIVLLDAQDRTRWNRAQIAEGVAL